MVLNEHMQQQAIPQFRNVYVRVSHLEQISKEDIEQFRSKGGCERPDHCQTVKYILRCVHNRTANGRKGTAGREKQVPPGYFIEALERELDRVRRFVETFGEEVWVSLGGITETVSKWKSNFKSPKSIREDSIPLEALDALNIDCDEIGENVILLDEFLRQNVIAAAFLAQQHDLAIASGDPLGGEQRLNSLGQVSPAYLQAMENYLMTGIHYDPILVGLSDAYCKIRQVRNRSVGADAVWNAPDKFERKTTKYWVHPADVLRLKSEVIKHLPILIYGKDKERKSAMRRLSLLKEQKLTDWNLISSVYFDDNVLGTYHERLRREHGASLVRFRWYGKQRFAMDDTIFIERKVHKDSWTGETSVKERAPLPAPQVFPMLKGEMVPGLKEDTSQAELLRDIQKRVVNEEPNLRTEYRRIAFQESSSNEVRMSLDTHLRMIREKNAPRAKGEWCRDMREGLDECDVIHFPYAVFEIKLAQEEPPPWVQNILDSGMIVEVPKFSKFLHGSSLLFGDKVRNTPFWFLPDGEGHMTPATLEEMADSSDKYDKGAAPFLFPEAIQKGPAPSQGPSNPQKMQVSTRCTIPNHSTVVSEVVVVPSDEMRSRMRSTIQESTSNPYSAKRLSKIHYTSAQRGRAAGLHDHNQKKRRGLFPWGRGSDEGRPLQSTLESGVDPARAQALVRTRIEPKTFFANERTFLSWLTIAVMVMFMGLSLLDGGSFGGMAGPGGGAQPSKCTNADGSVKPTCNGAKISGALIAPVALVLMLYSLYMFRKRSIQILRRDNVRYDDQRGPALLTALLVVVLIIAFIVSLTYSGG
ncbi:hypothetical protein BSKO_13798 [Bryopsis sp. KO-2023]|nr:hypothetical protein BSKO_13798 [Bryopsis sp. KO-2023]